jgi:hypothetical protein
MGGKKQKSTSSSSVTLPSWLQAPLQDYYLDTLENTRNLVDKPYEAYTGDRLSPFSADEQQAFNLTRDLVNQGPVDLSYSKGISQEVANRGLNGFSQQTLDQYMNPYMTNVMDVSRGRQLDEFDRQKTALQQQQGATGAFGGSRSALAQDQLYNNFSRNLSENEAMQLYQSYNDAQNRAFQGTQLAGQAGMDWANQALQERTSGIQGISALQASGQAQRGLDQTGLDLNYSDWATEQAYPYQQLQFGQGMVDSITNLFKGQQTVNTQSSGGSALGTALGLASMAMGIPGVGAAAMGGLGSMATGLGASSIGAGLTSMGGYMGATGAGMGQAMNWMQQAPSMVGNTPIRWYKKGGQVLPQSEEHMKYEDNDSVSRNTATIADKVNRFYDMMEDARRQYAEQSPDDPMLYEGNDSVVDNVLPAYKSGGLVKGYANGGTVMSPEEEWLMALQSQLQTGALENPNNIRNVPMDLPTQNTGLPPVGTELPLEDVTALINSPIPQASQKTRGLGAAPQWKSENAYNPEVLRTLGRGLGILPKLDNGKEVPQPPDTGSMWNRFQSRGGLAGLAADAGGAIGDTGLAKWAVENPDDAVGLALSMAPMVGPVAKAAKPVYGVAKAGLGSLMKMGAKNPKVADFLARAGISATGLGMLSKSNKADVAAMTPEEEIANQLAATIQGTVDPTAKGMAAPQTSDDTKIPSLQSSKKDDKVKPMSEKKHEMNTALMAFGASLLGSDRPFFQALGDATKAGLTEKSNKEKRIQEVAQKELDNELARRRLAAYELQNSIAYQRATNPFTQMKMEADARLKMQKLNQNPEAMKVFTSLISSGDPKYTQDPQATMQLALSTTGGGMGSITPQADISDEELLSLIGQ